MYFNVSCDTQNRAKLIKIDKFPSDFRIFVVMKWKRYQNWRKRNILFNVTGIESYIFIWDR